MTRLDKFVYAMIRCSIGAAAALILLASCAGNGETQAAQDQASIQEDTAGQPTSVGQSIGTDYDALYDELAGA